MGLFMICDCTRNGIVVILLTISMDMFDNMTLFKPTRCLVDRMVKNTGLNDFLETNNDSEFC